MKEKIIDTAGRIWQFLGQKGETDINVMPKRLKDKNEIVFQSIGWLAREEKITYIVRGKKTLISLVDPEVTIFNSIMKHMSQQKKESKLKPARTVRKPDKSER